MADLAALDLLASALAGRELGVVHAQAGEPAWTDGNVIHVDGAAASQAQVAAVCVQCALLAAGSLQRDIVKKLARRPALARRYLAVEAHRALSQLEGVLPQRMRALIDPAIASCTESAEASLALAQGDAEIAEPPAVFGIIQVRALMSAMASAPDSAANAAAGQHQPRSSAREPLRELADDAAEEDDGQPDAATSPVGGGGGLGRQMQKLLRMVRRLGSGGAPGADAPTHWSRSGPRAGVRAVVSSARVDSVEDAFGPGKGVLYPEWNVHRRSYRPDWCTVQEIDAPRSQHGVAWLDGYGLRRPLSRLGMGLDRYRRQSQGDDIDIDAAIEQQVELRAGTVPDEACYIDSQRHRRDLSVLILLDVSGSVAQAAAGGRPVHELQRNVAAALATVLYEIGDRVALYAFHSQGRSAVHMVPVKRFDEGLDSAVMGRLHALIPGAYSRLGAAIRHGTTQLIARGGTARRLLVLLSDGLAYDHGYEPAYGAADARKALGEARREGVGCVCLSVGAGTDTQVLQRVFGSAAFATVPTPQRLAPVIGPLFHAALKAAQVQRRVA